MSVLIKDMEVPKNCLTCKLRGDGSDSKYVWDCPFTGLEYTREEGETRRLDDCPLVEIPAPHGRLIDADATMKQWGIDKATKYGNETSEQRHFSYSTMMMYEIADIFDDAPTVIEAEEGEGE